MFVVDCDGLYFCGFVDGGYFWLYVFCLVVYVVDVLGLLCVVVVWLGFGLGYYGVDGYCVCCYVCGVVVLWYG